MPGINLTSLGLNVTGTLLNKKRIAVYSNDLKKEILQGQPYGAAQAAAIVNQFVNVPALMNATEQAEFTEPRITQNSRLAKHPVENGSQFADYAVFEAVTVQMDIILPGGFGYGLPNIVSDNIIKELQEIYNMRTFCAIVTSSDVYKNMVLISRPPVISVKNFNRAQFNLKFEQILDPALDATALNESNIKEPFDAAKKLIGKLG